MILQTDYRLPKQVNKYGCYFMCILWFANKYRHIILDTTYITDFYHECVRHGHMDADCYIHKPDDLFRNQQLYAVYTGKHESPDKPCARGQIEILRWETPKGSPHFVAGDGAGHVTYDPMGVSRTVRIGKLESKRIFAIYD